MSRLMNLYAQPSIVITKGLKSTLFDSSGKQYLDFCSGIAVNALGHADENLLKIMNEQARKLIHLSNLYQNEHAGVLADQLCSHLKSKNDWVNQKVFFCNSGTEANEAAFKFARKYAKKHFGPEKHKIISFSSGFHGRTFGSLSATPSEKYQKPFTPLVPGFVHFKFNSLDFQLPNDTCAVVVEPIQGEGGIFPAKDEFLLALREQCDKIGALLIFDEIQCGLGRSGTMYAHLQTPVVPDIMTLAKPLANGYPLGAVISGEKVANSIAAGEHGTTFGGSPLATALGTYVVGRVGQPSFLNHVEKMGKLVEKRAKELIGPVVQQVRGKGLIRGIQLSEKIETKTFVQMCLDQGLMMVAAGSQTIRIVPPLIITEKEIHQGMDIIQSVSKKLEASIN